MKVILSVPQCINWFTTLVQSSKIDSCFAGDNHVKHFEQTDRYVNNNAVGLESSHFNVILLDISLPVGPNRVSYWYEDTSTNFAVVFQSQNVAPFWYCISVSGHSRLKHRVL